MLFFVSIYAIGLLAFFFHWSRLPENEKTRSRWIELFLLYQLVFSLGITSIVAFFGLTFMPDHVAEITGWPASPFEQQLANVNLGYGLLGIMCIWYRRLFWAATIFGFSVWILGDGIHHAWHWLVHGNDSPGNIGVPLFTDIAIPVILLVLFYYYNKTN